jgi:AcrR family transcriptional regulator
MSPRPYRLGRRRASTERTRGRIIDAARTLLGAGGGFAGFTIDAVARQAGVSRMTVYYQFGSKRGLLEALFDDLAARGLVEHLPAVFERPEPEDALAALITAFSHFWASDRSVLRRIRGLAALDPDVDQAVRARDQRRRDHLRAIVGSMAKPNEPVDAAAAAELVDVLHTLTSFETFDALAGETHGVDEVAALIQRLARAILLRADEEAGDDGGRAHR